MAKVGAQRAAELTGKSKSTIQRAMNAGKLSFEVDANQRRLVDVSELERVFGIQPQGGAPSRDSDSDSYVDRTSAVEMELEKARHAIEIERLKMEVRLAQEQADVAMSQVEDLKVQRDLWQKQAQQILITSQYSQKQAEERITEMQMREEARKAQAETRRMQQSAVNHVAPQPAQATPRPAQAAQQAARPAQTAQPRQQQQQPAQQQQQAQQQAAQQAAAQREAAQREASAQTPIFRTVQAGNQNRTAAQGSQRGSLFASLFGLNKKSRSA